MQSGTIKKLVSDRGFGFIAAEDGKEYFFHRSGTEADFDSLNGGEKVNITGFGVFEKRARAARTARNPRTGETVKVKKTNVPAFRAGTNFKEVISGAKKLPRVASARCSCT